MTRYIAGLAGKAVRPHRLTFGASMNRWACMVCRKGSGNRDDHGVLPVSCEPTPEALERYRANQREKIENAQEALAWADQIEMEMQ